MHDVIPPGPTSDLMAVIDDFWVAYAQRRETGMQQNESVGSALREVMPQDQLVGVARMLWGSLDRQLSINGRRLRAQLVAHGDHYWKSGILPRYTELTPRTKRGAQRMPPAFPRRHPR
jgi:hypothetical protein